MAINLKIIKLKIFHRITKQKCESKCGYTIVIVIIPLSIVLEFSSISFLRLRLSDQLSMMLHGLIFSPCFLGIGAKFSGASL